MPTVRRSLWSLWLVWIVCLGLSIGGYALAASGLADKGMERLAQAWDVVSQAMKVTLATTLAGERNASSATDSYVAVRQEANASIISKTTAVTIGGGVANDTHLMGLMIHTALTGTCAITGFADSDGVAQTYTLPAGSVGYKDFLGAINSAGALTITCSNASDDNLVMVLWRPL